MPRTKFRKGFKQHPIIVFKRDDCFNGMFTQMILAREIHWPHEPLKGEAFLIHKVPGHYRLWTITHKASGLDVLRPGEHGADEAQARQLAQARLKKIGELLAFMLPRNIVGGVVTEKQMISLSRKDGKPWGNKHHDPQTYIQKMLLGTNAIVAVNNRMIEYNKSIQSLRRK